MTLYGRQRGRPLSESKASLLTALLPRIEVTLPCGDPRRLFSFPVKSIELEIGFGFGERLAQAGREDPRVGLIGSESFRNGIAHLLSLIESDRLDNIRIFPNDARLLLETCAPASVDRCWVLFPDPWPKRRHHKRRFITPSTLDRLADLLKDRGTLYLATDEPSLARWMFEHTWRHPKFEWTARSPLDWGTRPVDAPPTRYEQRALRQGSRPIFLHFERRSRQG